MFPKLAMKFELFVTPLVSQLSLSGLCSIDGMMINEYEAVGGMRAGRGNQNISSKPTLVPVCPPKISHDII
jgi:hypothetical protein